MTPSPDHPTTGETFTVGTRVYRCLMVVAMTPENLALYECNACAGVTTDPERHGPACGAARKLRGAGVAVTVPLPGR